MPDFEALIRHQQLKQPTTNQRLKVVDSPNFENEKNEEKIITKSGLLINFLGSFIVLNTDAGSVFVDKWYEEQSTIVTPNKESPALTKAVIKHTSALFYDRSSKYKVGVVEDKIVNCNFKEEEIDNTSIIHFKSGGSTKVMKQRILGGIKKSGYFDIAERYLNDQ